MIGWLFGDPVSLVEQCRRQQVRESSIPMWAALPPHAISVWFRQCLRENATSWWELPSAALFANRPPLETA